MTGASKLDGAAESVTPGIVRVDRPVRPLRNGKRLINVHEGTGLPDYYISAERGTEAPFVAYEATPVHDVRYLRRCEAALRLLLQAQTPEGRENCERIARDLLRPNVCVEPQGGGAHD